MERSERAGRRRAAGLAVAIVGIALAAWFAWPREPDPGSLQTEPHATAERAQLAKAAAPSSPAREEAVPARVAEAAPAPAAPSSFAFEFVAFTRDEWSLPVATDRPAFNPVNAWPLQYSGGWAAEGNELRFRWLGPRPRGELVFASGHLLRKVVIDTERPLRIAQGKGLWQPRPPKPLAEAVELDLGSLMSPGFGPVVAPLVAFLDAGDRTTVGHVGVAPTLARNRPPKQGTLVGQVTTAVGSPAREFVVRALGQKTPAKAQADGTFAFAPMEVGEYELEAGSRDGGAARAKVRLAEGTQSVVLQLVAGPAVRGRVVDPLGAGVANARVVWCTRDGDFVNHVVSAADGAFVVPTNSVVPGMVWACVPGDGARWPVAGEQTRSDAGDVALVVASASCRGSMHVTVPAGATRARLWQRASGFGMELWCTRSDETGTDFAAIGLPAGHYALELLSPELGSIDGGMFWCDGATDVAMPRIDLPRPCAVTVVLREGSGEPSAFEFVRTDCDFPSRVHTELGIAATHRLGPGSYELWWRFDRNAPPKSFAFTVDRERAEMKLRLP